MAALKISFKLFWEMHFQRGMSMSAMARAIGCNRKTIRLRFKLLGIKPRLQSSARTCVECGAPAEKQFHAKRDKNGERILYGTRCKAHRMKYLAMLKYKLRRKKDPLVGVRRRGAWKENRKSDNQQSNLQL